MIKYSAPHSIEFEIPLFRVQLRRKTRVKIIKINKKLKIFIYLTTWFTCQERSFNPKSRCGYMEVVHEFRGVLLTLCCHQLFRNGEESNVEDSRDLTEQMYVVEIRCISLSSSTSFSGWDLSCPSLLSGTS